MAKSKYANWYSQRRWREMRRLHLLQEPLCRYHKERGMVVPAQVVDHVVPHRGDEQKFWCGELQSLCHTCHSSAKQSEDSGKPLRGCGVDGIPLSGW